MPLEQLTYTPSDPKTSQDHPNTMVLMVDEEMLGRYQRDKSIPLANVVDSFEVLKYAQGSRSGMLGKPSKRELEETFGTTRDDEIVEFMLQHGEIHGKHLM